MNFDPYPPTTADFAMHGVNELKDHLNDLETKLETLQERLNDLERLETRIDDLDYKMWSHNHD